MAERRVPRSLRLRLALAFVTVAVLAVAALAVVILLATRSETSTASARARAQTADQAAAALAAAHRTAGSWEAADVSPARALAASADAVLVVRDRAGTVVLDTRPGAGRGPGPGGAAGSGRGAGPGAGPVLTRDVTVAGSVVGEAELRFRTTLAAADRRVRERLGNAALLGSLAAVALALVAAGLVAARITRPLRHLTATARRVREGDLSARAAGGAAPGELGELADAFDAMAATLERQERSRRALVADLAHEVRTPLAVLRADLEELAEGAAEPAPERLASLHEEVLRLGSLVAQLDALAAAEAPAAPLHRGPVDLAELAAHGIDAVRAQAAAKGLELVAELEPAVVDGDRAKLGQVVANLLSNALKFTPEGGRVAVRTGSDADAATLEVADTGPGITEADLPRVFDRFWRGAAARDVTGRGLGLAIAAELARAHGGDLRADARPGGGARFELRLPRRR